ncbi:hypothetical protein ACFLVX_04505 [Chloroflexota bacterium]
MAAAMCKGLIASDKMLSKFNIVIDSAGTRVGIGDPVSRGARDEMEKRQLDIEDHLSRNLESIDLTAYDLILTMQQKQKRTMLMNYPEVKNRVLLLSEYAGGSGDIGDPMADGNYSFHADEIEEYLAIIIGRWSKLVGQNSSLD